MAAATTKSKKRRHRAGFGEIPNGTRRVAIYVRRSTDDEHQPFSIEAQLTSLTSYVNSQPGWVLIGDPYSEDASGASTDRPHLQRALNAARAGRFDVLLVYRVDRFSRRLSDLLDLLTELDEAGVAFASATEPFDTATAIGRMLVQLLGVFAEFERETIIDRVINGMTAKARKGKWPGGTRPYGYHVDSETQKLVIHDTEAPILREIVRLYANERLGTRGIADELNRRGIPNRTGRKWSGLTIGRILDNPAYIGDMVYGDVCVNDAHPALVDRETWRRVRGCRSLPRRVRERHHGRRDRRRPPQDPPPRDRNPQSPPRPHHRRHRRPAHRPEPSTLARIRAHLTKVITDGTSAERKATIEDLIAEIRIDEDEGIIPVFKIPGPDYAPPGDNPATPTTEAAEPDAVRAMLRSVGRAGLEPATEGL
jgi:DNA invertase Pin-like site-specific DNA recombinase